MSFPKSKPKALEIIEGIDILYINIGQPRFGIQFFDKNAKEHFYKCPAIEKNLLVAPRDRDFPAVKMAEKIVDHMSSSYIINGHFHMDLVNLNDVTSVCRKLVIEHNLESLFNELNPPLEEVLCITNEIFTKKVLES
jgi:hypothetical protein